MSKPKSKGPQFIRFFIPLIEALKEIGGSGTASEVIDLIIVKLGISQKEQDELLKSGQPKIKNQIYWARFYLARGGYLDSSQRGIWTLTEKGSKTELKSAEALSLFKEIHEKFNETLNEKDDTFNSNEEEIDEFIDHKSELLNILKSLTPEGFEKICQYLLRESGFENVIVTGKSGDGGIDGHGILQINPLVSFRVLFQCKRYQGSVSPAQIRDFRGAMQGRTDKGIILTTGTFSLDARKESIRDGAPTIELVDGEKLVQMFESLEIGLKPRRAYEVDYDFFEKFSKNM